MVATRAPRASVKLCTQRYQRRRSNEPRGMRAALSIAAALLVFSSAGFGCVYAWHQAGHHGPALAVLAVAMALGLEVVKPFAVEAVFGGIAPAGGRSGARHAGARGRGRRLLAHSRTLSHGHNAGRCRRRPRERAGRAPEDCSRGTSGPRPSCPRWRLLARPTSCRRFSPARTAAGRSAPRCASCVPSLDAPDAAPAARRRCPRRKRTQLRVPRWVPVTPAPLRCPR